VSPGSAQTSGCIVRNRYGLRWGAVVQSDHVRSRVGGGSPIYMSVGGRARGREAGGVAMNKKGWLCVCLLGLSVPAGGEDLGQLSVNPYAPNSTANPYSPAGSEHSSTSVRNPYGPYGSPYSNQSATNPYATDAPKLYDADGNYRGKLSSNPYDPDSISNPYGRYGSPYSADSVNNPYGAGNPYRSDSPTNPYGQGWNMRSGEDETPAVTTPRYAPRVPSYTPPSYTPPAIPAYRAPSTRAAPATRSPWSVASEDDDSEDGAKWP